jgi:hypothetical protein
VNAYKLSIASFPPLAAVLDVGGPSIIWIRVGNTRRAALLTWFAELLPSVIIALDKGERIIEIG